MFVPNFMILDPTVVKLFYSGQKSLIKQHHHQLLWMKAVIKIVSVYVCVHVVCLKSLEVSDMAAVFTR